MFKPAVPPAVLAAALCACGDYDGPGSLHDADRFVALHVVPRVPPNRSS